MRSDMMLSVLKLAADDCGGNMGANDDRHKTDAKAVLVAGYLI
jgi:hypothetical protein